MHRQKLHILLMLLVALLLPAMLFARRRHQVAEAQTSLLSPDEQQRFDSLYMLALTLQQTASADSAVTLMLHAAHYTDSLCQARGVTAPTAAQVPGLAAAYFFVSNHCREQNDAAGALYAIDRAVSIDTVNYWYTDAAGDLYMALKQFPEARICYERLVRQYPDKSEPLYSMADIYLHLDSIDLGLQALDRIEELEGINPQLTQYKFSILARNGRADEGFAQYQKLIERYPYNVQYRIHLGNLQMQNGKIAEARQTYDAAAAIEPDNAYVWVAEANYYSMTGDQEAADTLVASALTNANLDVETKAKVMEEYLRGSFRKLSQYRSQVEQGAVYSSLDTLALFGKVDSLFSRVVAMHPSADDLYALQAEWRNAMGQDSLASECMRFAVDLKPTEQDYWEKLLYYSTPWMPKPQVIALTREAIAQHPSCQTAYLVAAWAYVQQGQDSLAILQYRAAIDNISPPDANRVSQLWGSIGDLYYRMKQLDQAFECYDRAVKYNPNNYAALNNYAYYLSEERRDLSKAEQMATQVIQKHPDNPTYLDTYAWILYLEGSYTLAEFYQQHAIDCITPDDADNYTLFDHFGDIKVKLNDLRGAVVQWRRALECSDVEDPERIQRKIDSAELLLQ